MSKENENKKEEKIIIVNRMYVGDYLSWGKNIGHEAINLYKADDGCYYNYLPAYGNIPEERKKVLKKADITVLMVRNYAKDMWKIIGKLENCVVLDSAYGPKYKKRQPELDGGTHGEVTYDRVTYDGVSIRDLFKGNIETEKNNSDTGEEIEPLLATFKANAKDKDKDNLMVPNEPVFITSNEKYENKNKNIYYINANFTKSSLRQYFPENHDKNENGDKKPDAFKVLDDIIENKDLWKPASGEINNPEMDSSYSFMDIIKQEDNELAFSNMFAHFFTKYEDLFSKFVEDVLNKKHLENKSAENKDKKISLGKDYKIEREKENIDLLITDAKNCIVIENKIKSLINGIKNDGKNAEDGKIKSQLSKYYEYVTKKDEEYKNKNCYFFIFVPDYNDKLIDNENYSEGEKYTKIKYSDIYGFFNKEENKKQFSQYLYYDEFVKSLKKHAKPYDNSLELEMQRRFYKATHPENE